MFFKPRNQGLKLGLIEELELVGGDAIGVGAEALALQALVPQPEAVVLPKQNLELVAAAITKDEKTVSRSPPVGSLRRATIGVHF